jgi:hypothetical protein
MITVSLADQLELADCLLALVPKKAIHPNELPGRYGRVVRDLERLLGVPQVLLALRQIHPTYATELQALIIQAQQEQS